jgi:hypothetical protein
MSKVRSGASARRSAPALTPEARENQLIARAVDLAEQQLIDGTASSQVITHFLKLGSVKAQVELEKLKSENELLKAKTESLQSMKNIESLYANAMSAMRSYGASSATSEDDA